MDKDAGLSVSIGFGPKYKRLNRFANITVCKSALQISSFCSSCRESTVHLCMYSFSHYLIQISTSTLLQTMKTGSYSDPLRVTQTASETSSMPAMWMYVALHCVCMYYVYILCVCVLQPAGLQVREQIHSCSG